MSGAAVISQSSPNLYSHELASFCDNTLPLLTCEDDIKKHLHNNKEACPYLEGRRLTLWKMGHYA